MLRWYEGHDPFRATARKRRNPHPQASLLFAVFVGAIITSYVTKLVLLQPDSTKTFGVHRGLVQSVVVADGRLAPAAAAAAGSRVAVIAANLPLGAVLGAGSVAARAQPAGTGRPAVVYPAGVGVVNDSPSVSKAVVAALLVPLRDTVRVVNATLWAPGGRGAFNLTSALHRDNCDYTTGACGAVGPGTIASYPSLHYSLNMSDPRVVGLGCGGVTAAPGAPGCVLEVAFEACPPRSMCMVTQGTGGAAWAHSDAVQRHLVDAPTGSGVRWWTRAPLGSVATSTLRASVAAQTSATPPYARLVSVPGLFAAPAAAVAPRPDWCGAVGGGTRVSLDCPRLGDVVVVRLAEEVTVLLTVLSVSDFGVIALAGAAILSGMSLARLLFRWFTAASRQCAKRRCGRAACASSATHAVVGATTVLACFNPACRHGLILPLVYGLLQALAAAAVVAQVCAGQCLGGASARRAAAAARAFLRVAAAVGLGTLAVRLVENTVWSLDSDADTSMVHAVIDMYGSSLWVFTTLMGGFAVEVLVLELLWLEYFRDEEPSAFWAGSGGGSARLGTASRSRVVRWSLRPPILVVLALNLVSQGGVLLREAVTPYESELSSASNMVALVTCVYLIGLAACAAASVVTACHRCDCARGVSAAIPQALIVAGSFLCVAATATSIWTSPQTKRIAHTPALVSVETGVSELNLMVQQFGSALFNSTLAVGAPCLCLLTFVAKMEPPPGRGRGEGPVGVHGGAASAHTLAHLPVVPGAAALVAAGVGRDVLKARRGSMEVPLLAAAGSAAATTGTVPGLSLELERG